MKVLVVGGGREHALVCKIAQSPKVQKIYCAPGNGGTRGIEQAEKLDCVVFNAGTKIENEKLVTAGGRVLGVTALGSNHEEAIKNAYEGVKVISFKDAHYRKDIGIK